MKVALVLDTTLDSDAGVQQFFRGLAGYLLKNGHDVRFLVPPSPKSREKFCGKVYSFGFNLTFKNNANTIPVGFYFGTRKLKKIIKKEKFDIVHVAAPYSPLLSGKIIRYAKCPKIVSYMVRGKSKVLNKLYSWLTIFVKPSLSKVDYFIAVSDAAKREAEYMVDYTFDVIPLGVDLSRFTPKTKPLKKFDDGKFNILFFGRLEDRKGAIYLLKAYKKIQAQVRNTRLIVAGDGPEREKLEKYKKVNSLENVVFEGYIDEQIKNQYFSSADICVFPALYGESFGIVLLEAMATGKVTLGYSNSGYRYVLKHPQLLVRVKSVNELASRILLFTKNNKLKKEYEKKCLQRAAEFSWDVVGQQILNVYNGLLKKR